MDNVIKENYIKSKKEYNNFRRENHRYPTIKEWNQIAKEKNLLSNVSMQCMGKISFRRKN